MNMNQYEYETVIKNITNEMSKSCITSKAKRYVWINFKFSNKCILFITKF